jgi:hypothetical protein
VLGFKGDDFQKQELQRALNQIRRFAHPSGPHVLGYQDYGLRG